MKKIKQLEIPYTELETRTDLSPEDEKLLSLAEAARSRSYSPYSGFSVGASVLLDNG